MSVPVDAKGTSRDDLVLLRGAKAHMAESVAQRNDERPIVGWRAFLPLIGASIGLLVLILLAIWLRSWESLVVGFVFLYTLTSAFVVLLNYLLAKGLSTHARREAMFRRGAIEYLRATASKRGSTISIEPELATLESIERDANTESLPRSLYTAFGALPLFGIIVTLYYLRSIDSVQVAHVRRWAVFARYISASCGKLGLASKPRASTDGRKGHFVPFAVITLIFPPFLVLWYHILLDENGRHLEAQHADEDILLQLLA